MPLIYHVAATICNLVPDSKKSILKSSLRSKSFTLSLSVTRSETGAEALLFSISDAKIIWHVSVHCEGVILTVVCRVSSTVDNFSGETLLMTHFKF